MKWMEMCGLGLNPWWDIVHVTMASAKEGNFLISKATTSLSKSTAA
jgi:hypothetical protein